MKTKINYKGLKSQSALSLQGWSQLWNQSLKKGIGKNHQLLWDSAVYL